MKRVDVPINIHKDHEIPLWIDDYDDIFSDFDSRQYHQRALSDDFLLEAKKASRDKIAGNVELKFTMPAKQRNRDSETLIKRRLREHFRRHHFIMHEEIKKIIRRGLSFIFAGIIFMILATYLHYKFEEPHFIISFLIILLEPAGWFSFWEGLNQVIFESKTKKPDLDFYEKMANCNIVFVSELPLK